MSAPSGSADAIDGYARAAPELIPAYRALSLSEDVCVAARARLAEAGGAGPRTALDVGAGVGHDAAFLADLGYETSAVEPVAAFRTAGQTHGLVRWLDQRLPDLPGLIAERREYDFILVSAVWHHLTVAERTAAGSTLHTLCRPGGVMVLSLRSGPYPPTRPGWPTVPDVEQERLTRVGWRIENSVGRLSAQSSNRSAGVTWTWLTLRRPGTSEAALTGDLMR